MAWNLNNKKRDYELSRRVTNELIDMYGLEVKFVKTELVNIDDIFNESTNLKANLDNVFDVFVKPENPAMFEDGNLLSKFGFSSVSSINLFISAKSVDMVFEDQKYITNAVGCLIMLPSGKWLEVVSLEVQVPGINNMFLYNNQKNVFMLVCKPYSYNNDEIEDVIRAVSSDVYEDEVPDLTNIFNLDIYEKKSNSNRRTKYKRYSKT